MTGNNPKNDGTAKRVIRYRIDVIKVPHQREIGHAVLIPAEGYVIELASCRCHKLLNPRPQRS